MPVTRIRAGRVEYATTLAAVRKSKPFGAKFGGELDANELHGDQHAGQWPTWQRFPNTEKAEQFYNRDAGYQQVMAQALAPFTIVDRLVVVGIDTSE